MPMEDISIAEMKTQHDDAMQEYPERYKADKAWDLAFILEELRDTECSLLRETRFFDSSTLLHVAASFGHDQIVEAILSKQQCQELLMAKNSSGDLPLHVAVNAGHLPVVQQLVNFNVDVACQLLKEKNKEGITPLHLALIKRDTPWEDNEGNYTDVAKFLIGTGRKDAELMEIIKEFGKSLSRCKARLVVLFKQ